MSRTVLPLEDTRASSISELKDLAPQTDHVATLEGESFPADGGSNIFWWDPSGDPSNADGLTKIESNIESTGLWRRVLPPVPETTDDLPEGSSALYYTTSRVRNALSAAGDLNYDPSTGEFSIATPNLNSTDDLAEGSNNKYFTISRARSALSAGGDLNYDVTTGEFSISTSGLTSTDDLGEGSSNLYFTEERVDDRINNLLVSGVHLSSFYDDSAGSFILDVDDDLSSYSNDVGFITDLSSFTTDDLFEGSGNLYYTSNRVRDEFVAGGDLAYDKNVARSYDLTTTSYTGKKIDVSSEANESQGITFNDDGTKMFLVGTVDNTAYEYDLGTSFDISTASYSGTSFDVSTDSSDITDPNVTEIQFNTSGSKMFICKNRYNRVSEYDLSTAFDISTANLSTYFYTGNEAYNLSVMVFNPDGTKMFAFGGPEEIFEYDLGTGFDISTASYSGKSFDTSNIEAGSRLKTFNDDGTRMFSVDFGGMVYEFALGTGYDISTASYSGISYDLTNETVATPRSIEFSNDGRKMFVTEDDPSNVYQYTVGQARSEAEFSIDVSEVDDLLSNVTTDDLDEGTKNLYYTSDKVEAGGDLDYEKNPVYGFELSAPTYSGTSFDVESEEKVPAGVTFSPDGTKMYIAGKDTQKVFEYNLSTGFDVSTASYSGVSHETAESQYDQAPRGIEFNPDGTKMFVVEELNDNVSVYELSTGFDLSTATYRSSRDLNIASEEPNPRGIAFNDGGTKMFVVGESSGSVHEYNLSTGYDMLTASYTGTSFDVSSEDVFPNGLSFNGDGTEMFIIGNDNKFVYEYGLSTGFDISTASYSGQSFDVSNEDKFPTEVTFSADGTKMFVIGTESDEVHEYDTSAIGKARFSIDVSEVGDLLSSSTTDDLNEGSNNLYHTTSRVRNAFSAGGDLNYDSSTGEFSVSTSSGTDLSSKTTDDLSEGSNNLYFTDQRAQNAVDFATGENVQYKEFSGQIKFEAEYDLSGQSDWQDAEALAFNGDGTKVFFTGDNSSTSDCIVVEYDLGTAYDVQTLSYTGNTFPNTYGNLTGIDFNPGGTKMFVSDESSNQIIEYSLGSGYDLSSNVSENNTYDKSSEGGAGPDGLELGDGGNKLFVIDNGDVYEYSLGTAYDLSTISYTTSFGLEDNENRAISFNSDGSVMYATLGTSFSSALKYELSTPLDISSASYTGTEFSNLKYDNGRGMVVVGSKLFGVDNERIGQYTLNPTPKFSLVNISGVEESTTDDLDEGNNNLYYESSRVKDEFETAGDLEYTKNPSSGYDFSNASYSGTSFDVGNEDSIPKGLAFNADGSKMFISGLDNANVYEYNLGTKFDVSTASYSGTNFGVGSESGSPRGLAFGDNGTKMYFTESSNDSIYEYDLSTGYDVSTASYSGTNFDVSSEINNPNDLGFNGDGTKVFVVGYSNNKIYEYSLNSGFDLSTASFTTSFDVSSEDTSPKRISFNGDGTKMFVLGTSSNSVHEYSLGTGFDVSTASFATSFDVSSEDTGWDGLAFSSDGTKMFALGGNNTSVFQYGTGSTSDTAQFSVDVSGVGDSTTDDLSEGSSNLYFTEERVDDRVESLIVPGSNLTQSYNDSSESLVLDVSDNLSDYSNDAGFITGLSGFTTDDLTEGSNLYYTSDRVRSEFEAGGDLSYVKNPVFGFDLSAASYSGTSFDVSSEDGISAGVSFSDDGTKMFLVGLDNQSIFEYNLSAGFDISTASYSGTSLNVAGEDGGPRGIAFNGDGTKMLLAGATDNNVYEYDLSTGFDLSTASYSGTSFDISSEEGDVRAIAFNSDGTKMFITGSSSATSSSADVHEYNLGSGYDISTASYSGTVFDVSSEESTPLGISFSSDGKKMFIVGNGNNTVYEYGLTAGFDISSASYSGTSFDISSEESGYPTAVTFNSNGTKMFTTGSSSDQVHEYSTVGTGGKAQFSIDVSEIDDLLSSSTTDDLNEGSNNLYFTEERVDDRVSGLLTPGLHLSSTYNDGSDSLVLDVDDDLSQYDNSTSGFISDLSSFSTGDLNEGSNLYFTDERAQDATASALTGGSNIQINYDDAANEIGIDFAGISAQDDGTEVLSEANSLDFGKALAATDGGSGVATVDLDAGFSSATFSGDGTTTQFQIPHGLSSRPSSWIVQSGTADGSDISHVTADGTNLTVNYSSAPPSGTDNIELNWIAIQ